MTLPKLLMVFLKKLLMDFIAVVTMFSSGISVIEEKKEEIK